MPCVPAQSCSLVRHDYSAHKVMRQNAYMTVVRLQGSLAIKMRLRPCNLLSMVMKLSHITCMRKGAVLV